MPDKFRIGLIGSGFAATFHYEAIMNVKRIPVEVVGVYSQTPENREKFAEERAIKAFDNPDDLINAVDVVDVLTPPSSHEDYCVKAANSGKHVIVEKPLTGYFGPPNANESWRGDEAPKEVMLEEAINSARRIVEAVHENNVLCGYAENWVYAPAITKETEIIKGAKSQLLWIMAGEGHSGSHAQTAGLWRFAGGGAVMGKASHPVGGVLYLKRVEGEANNGKPIRPASVSARVHEITRLATFKDFGHIRTNYTDVEDYGQLHIVFEDGMVADIFASDLVLGGLYDWAEVFANNHRIRLNISMHDCCKLYTPKEEYLTDVYVAEKLGTKQGWSFPSPSEHWMEGYDAEIQDFILSMYEGRAPLSNEKLGADVTAIMYAAYLSAERKGAEVEIPLV
jgi:predicted dehydrogenase